MNFETVLIIHNSKPEREMLREFVMVDSGSIQIREVKNESEAEQILRQQHFDIILSSVILDGFKELVEGGTHIIILLPDESEEQLARMAEQGLTNYQVFPTGGEDLQDKLNSVTRDGVSRKHPRYDVPGTRIMFHHDNSDLEGRVLNISEGGFLCEIVLDASSGDIIRDIPVTIKFPKKLGHRIIANIRCSFLATRKSTREGSRIRHLIVMLLPRLETHHFETLVLTLQLVIKRQHPLLRWHNKRLEINIGSSRTYYQGIHLIRIFFVFIFLLFLAGGASYLFKVPEILWVPQVDKTVIAAKPVVDPQVTVKKAQIEFEEKIQFEKGDSQIKSGSYTLLNDIASVIRNNPHIRQISIEGHSDSDGSPEYNRTLSGERAEAVKKYLIAQGVSADILESRGFGESRPISNNNSAEGKQKNRRVEFVIVKQD